MRIDLPGIEAFLGIANWGSFRRAAAHMNLPRSGLQANVSGDLIGVPLRKPAVIRRIGLVSLRNRPS